MEMNSEPIRHITDPAKPFAGVDGIIHTFNPTIGSTEIGIAAKCDKIKKTGAAAYANAPVFHQCSQKLSINSTAGIIDNLFDF